MNSNIFSNSEFTEMKNRINDEIKRRGGFSWWDPLSTPSVGEDRTPAISTPAIGDRVEVDDKTYTINNPSEGSLERTRNIKYPAHGENPGGQDPEPISSIPNTSAAQVNVDEMKNYLIGLSKIKDINLFYGRDEIDTLAFRDPNGIDDLLSSAESDLLNKPLHESDISPTKNDPNGGMKDAKCTGYPIRDYSVTYPQENGIYVMPSGERDGEEGRVGPTNFFDDFGAKPGDGNYHPYNRHTSNLVCRVDSSQDNDRNTDPVITHYGNSPSSRFGANPRNPNQGTPYASRAVFGGMKGTCNSQCTGLCYRTCDNECSESCYSTCWNRCGEACTSTCGNVCTGCSTLCYNTCKTKCENTTGYACVKAGIKTTKSDGNNTVNGIGYEIYTCSSCDYSCQFYPNKKTECWDAGCMGKCFIACNTGCSESCYGGCMNNAEESSESYKTGKGKGCSASCTLNCIGSCRGVCEGYCVQTCWHACKSTCHDNCVWVCSTNCGSGCFQGCRFGCTGCTSCESSCDGEATSRGCTNCGFEGGCTSSCQHNCNKNCVGWGCRSLCGIDSAGACEANCRLNCMGTSCTALCSDACSGRCSTCVNSCGWQCGACSSKCSVMCGANCNATCSADCSSSCKDNCVHSCSELCGGCSDLCYSCVGMCIGICSLKCENGCSSCSNNCSWWCDTRCNQECFGNCSDMCLDTCSGSCSTYLYSETTLTQGPDREPTSNGFIYPHPKNRYEERESFRLFRYPIPYKKPKPEKKNPSVVITFTDCLCKYLFESIKDGAVTKLVIDAFNEEDKLTLKTLKFKHSCDDEYEDIFADDIHEYADNVFDGNEDAVLNTTPRVNDAVEDDDKCHCFDNREGVGRSDINKTVTDIFDGADNITLITHPIDDICNMEHYKRTLIVDTPSELKYVTKQTPIHGGIYDINKTTGEITISMDMLPSLPETNHVNLDGGWGIFIIELLHNEEVPLTDDDIDVIMPFGFKVLPYIHRDNGDIVIIIERDQFLFEEEIMNEEEDKENEQDN